MVRKNHTVLEGLPSILVNAAGGIMTTVGMTGWEQRKAGGGGGGVTAPPKTGHKVGLRGGGQRKAGGGGGG